MSEKIILETVEKMHYENSFGVVPNSTSTRTMVTSFRVNNETQYGSFEWYDKETGGDRYYADGGLWFKEIEGEETMKLSDFDGCFDLPPNLIQWLYDNDYLDQWHIDLWVKSNRLTLRD